MEWERQEELRKQKERAERIKREWERRMNPKTKEDFDLLYAHLESKYSCTVTIGLLVVCFFFLSRSYQGGGKANA